jgi:hypothetical protein
LTLGHVHAVRGMLVVIAHDMHNGLFLRIYGMAQNLAGRSKALQGECKRQQPDQQDAHNVHRLDLSS